MSYNFVYNITSESELSLPLGIVFLNNAIELSQESGLYNTSNPYITLPFVLRYANIASMVVNTNDLGEVRGLIEKEGKKYYYMGEWIESDGTFDQSNLITVLIANINSFEPGKVKNIQIGLFLHSAGGVDTPRVMDIRFIYGCLQAAILGKVKIYGYVENIQDNVDNYVMLDRDKTLLGNKIILREKIEIIPDKEGYFEIDLYSTDNMQDGAGYTFVFGDSRYYRFVPDVLEAGFNELPVKWM
jgi:hypothetical protein